MAYWQQQFYDPIFHCCDNFFFAMTKYENRDDDGYNDGNKDVKNNNNYTAGLGSYGKIFDMITTPWSRLGLVEEDRATKATALRPQRTMCIHFELKCTLYLPYKDHSKMFYKLLYAEIFVLDLCYQNMKKNQLN